MESNCTPPRCSSCWGRKARWNGCITHSSLWRVALHCSPRRYSLRGRKRRVSRFYLVDRMLEVEVQPAGISHHWVGGWRRYLPGSASPSGPSTSSTTMSESVPVTLHRLLTENPDPQLLRLRRLVSDGEGPRLLL